MTRSQESGGSGQRSEARSVKELVVSEKAFDLAMQVFQVSTSFPAKERFAVTLQIRRASRSVCLNLREAWAKRRSPAHFVSKLTDWDGENGETDSALDFALSCGYVTATRHRELTSLHHEVGRMLGTMLKSPTPFLLTPDP